MLYGLLFVLFRLKKLISMKSEILIKKLNYQSPTKEVRLEVAHWVIENPETFPQLLEICFKASDKTSYKAAWVLEYVCTEKMELLVPYFDLLFENLPKIYLDQAVRPFSKICLMLAKLNYTKKEELIVSHLKQLHKKIMTECCFDWLISNQKVATEAYAMSSLYYLGTEIDWIHIELKQIIQQNIVSKTGAYKARGRITIENISKFQNKKK